MEVITPPCSFHRSLLQFKEAAWSSVGIGTTAHGCFLERDPQLWVSHFSIPSSNVWWCIYHEDPFLHLNTHSRAFKGLAELPAFLILQLAPWCCGYLCKRSLWLAETPTKRQGLGLCPAEPRSSPVCQNSWDSLARTGQKKRWYPGADQETRHAFTPAHALWFCDLLAIWSLETFSPLSN